MFFSVEKRPVIKVRRTISPCGNIKSGIVFSVKNGLGRLRNEWGAGIYSSVPEACKAVVRTDKVQEPNAATVPEYEKFYQLYRDIYPALKTEFAKLAKL